MAHVTTGELHCQGSFEGGGKSLWKTRGRGTVGMESHVREGGGDIFTRLFGVTFLCCDNSSDPEQLRRK
jgi:hypothetical protein